MKSLNLLVLAAALFIALPASAQQVKPYHQNIKDCAACHTKENAVVAVDLRSLVLGVAGRTDNAFAVMVAGMRIGLTVLQVLGFFCDSCIALMAGQAGFVVGRDIGPLIEVLEQLFSFRFGKTLKSGVQTVCKFIHGLHKIYRRLL